MSKLRIVMVLVVFTITSFLMIVLPNSSTSQADVVEEKDILGVTQSYVVPSSVVTASFSRYSYSATTLTEMNGKILAREEAEQTQKKTKTYSWNPPRVTANPGSAQALAHDMVISYGWSENDFSCLVALWDRESGWNVSAHNSSSGAYGIPQALPGSKMGSAGADWETNPETQIRWGLGYIQGRYGSPCEAWAHSETVGWY